MKQKTASADPQRLGQPLSDAEQERLQAILDGFPAPEAMDVEEMDGYFAALICGPEAVLPNRYFQEVWGGGPPPFDTADEFEEFLDLAMRHWNSIADALLAPDGFFEPWFLLEPGEDLPRGNQWAKGFVRATRECYEAWRPFFKDEDKFALLIPMMALVHEHDPDPEMRSWATPPDRELREKLLVNLSVMTKEIYDTVRAHEPRDRPAQKSSASKTGRNDPCPCGSGKKYKRCCGGVTIH